jgi:hypothetical protein
MKKKPKKIELSHMPLTFLCPKGHKIKITHHFVKSPNTVRELATIPFSIECSECKWKGTMSGGQAILE